MPPSKRNVAQATNSSQAPQVKAARAREAGSTGTSSSDCKAAISSRLRPGCDPCMICRCLPSHAPSSACARHVWTRRRVHVVSTCPRGRLFALPSAATTSSSSSGGGGTAADHARPTAPALEAARGRVCASELDAHRAPCVRRSGPLWRVALG